MEVNGKEYPMWGQIIDKKDEWIGGTLTEYDMGAREETTIVDITLEPNGKESAYFRVEGEEFSCGFDVRYGGIYGAGGNSGLLTFSRSYMGDFTIEK